MFGDGYRLLVQIHDELLLEVQQSQLAIVAGRLLLLLLFV